MPAQLIALVQATLSGATNTNSQSIHAFLTGLLRDQLSAEESQARSRLLNIDFHRGYRVFVLQSRSACSSQTLDPRLWQIQSNELTGLPVHLPGKANAPAGKLLSTSFDDSLVLLAVGVPALLGSVEDLVEPLCVDSLRRRTRQARRGGLPGRRAARHLRRTDGQSPLTEAAHVTARTPDTARSSALALEDSLRRILRVSKDEIEQERREREGPGPEGKVHLSWKVMGR